VVKSLRENYHQIILELNQMIHDIRKEAIEDLESCINFDNLFLINKNEEKIQ